ncbi:ABC transporter ATP-binding protein [Brassicibacter mesophilus]|uniref:ABC transporter ATP-binding protein n=1 Tax=Brassicibacter mesophilus TaxID=745119 RepID=UPI003D1C7558
MSDILLEVKNLKTYFYTEDGEIPAVDGVDFYVRKGETLGIVGESGCGKSVTAMSVLRLIPNPPGVIKDGEVVFNDKKVLELSEKEMRNIRGNDISMIFQEPMTSLNPVFTIGDQIGEVLKLHSGLKKKESRQRCIELLKMVGIPRAEKVIDEYPHALSGGMRQRAMIAMALACNPKLLIADEPTTALDVTIQAQILELMLNLQKEFDTAIIFITHDLGVIAEVADRVIVMYAGKVVEEANVKELFNSPKHPYTVGLLKSKPDLDTRDERLYVVSGVVPNLLKKPKGCMFHPRCEFATDKCINQETELLEISEGRKVRCWLHCESEVEDND